MKKMPCFSAFLAFRAQSCLGRVCGSLSAGRPADGFVASGAVLRQANRKGVGAGADARFLANS